jgi:putative nucleotidyltransferase with HDIG domain
LAPGERAFARQLYRSRQFFAALVGRVSREEMEEARRVLGPVLYRLFSAMPGQYRAHMLAVYRRVREAGCDDPHLLQAALLHDSGKHDPASGRYVSLPYRVAIVLLEITPAGRSLLGRLASAGRKGGWRYPLHLNKHHARLGAERAAEYGAPPEVVRLIVEHHDYRQPDRALAALQAADDRS